jgi:hypothetical protein
MDIIGGKEYSVKEAVVGVVEKGETVKAEIDSKTKELAIGTTGKILCCFTSPGRGGSVFLAEENLAPLN